MVMKLNLKRSENLEFQSLLKKLGLNPNVIEYEISFFYFILG